MSRNIAANEEMLRRVQDFFGISPLEPEIDTQTSEPGAEVASSSPSDTETYDPEPELATSSPSKRDSETAAPELEQTSAPEAEITDPEPEIEVATSSPSETEVSGPQPLESSDAQGPWNTAWTFYPRVVITMWATLFGY